MLSAFCLFFIKQKHPDENRVLFSHTRVNTAICIWPWLICTSTMHRENKLAIRIQLLYCKLAQQHKHLTKNLPRRQSRLDNTPAASSVVEQILPPAAAVAVPADQSCDEAALPALCSSAPAPRYALPSCFAQLLVLGLPNHLCLNTANAWQNMNTRTL